MGNNIDYSSFESFKHGLVKSKLWLCNELEKCLLKSNMYDVHILAGWTNVLGFMIAVRENININQIHNYDIESSAIDIAKEITNTWQYESPKIFNHVSDIDNIDFSSHSNNSIYINCSVEHLDTRNWFCKLKNNSLVCIQSSDVRFAGHPWYIKDHSPTLEALKDHYPLKTILFEGTLPIAYKEFSYNRYMIIGYK